MLLALAQNALLPRGGGLRSTSAPPCASVCALARSNAKSVRHHFCLPGSRHNAQRTRGTAATWRAPAAYAAVSSLQPPARRPRHAALRAAHCRIFYNALPLLRFARAAYGGRHHCALCHSLRCSAPALAPLQHLWPRLRAAACRIPRLTRGIAHLAAPAHKLCRISSAPHFIAHARATMRSTRAALCASARLQHSIKPARAASEGEERRRLRTITLRTRSAWHCCARILAASAPLALLLLGTPLC